MQSRIRNFSIIAHIDHGKSTLADRLIEYCGAYTNRKFEEQILDSMELERERGITIKAQTVMLSYEYEGISYCLNLIDTPGHVDFSYEVSRSLAACEAALLVVDATQGVEAQTVANCYTALDAGVEIIPVINKIDLPASDPDKVRAEIEDVIGVEASSALLCSAKTGLGVEDILVRLIREAPAPSGSTTDPLRALIVDSWFDNYVGVVMLVRVVDGQLSVGDTIRFMSTNTTMRVTNVGVFTPADLPQTALGTGMVGYVVTGLRVLSTARVGDTLTLESNPAEMPLPGFKEIQPQVFAGLYPVENYQYDVLRDALEKLKLNDASLHYELELSDALGHGFRCGFLGLLHMDIVQQRLEREFDLDLVVTAPSVVYQVCLRDGSDVFVENPARLPDPAKITEIREPIIACSIYLPDTYVGPVMVLCAQKRGIQQDMHYHGSQVMMRYEMPLNEVVMDFFDKLKSVSRGYASFDYTFQEYRASPLLRLDILINGQRVDPLSIIVHKEQSQMRGRVLVQKLRGLIPRQMFDIAIQAAVGSHIIARETVKALRKNVIAKCYGGDITRKRKLLEKQKAGKKRMKQVGSVEIPQAAFLSVLSCDD